jgi:hypothetical protein
MAALPPRWDSDRLEVDRQAAIEIFRRERMEEPLEEYLEAFEQRRSAVETLLEATVDLSQLSDHAVEMLTDPALLEAVRYLAGPPISTDDLKTLTEASLAPTRLRKDPEMARQVVDTVLLGLDRNRFPWVAEGRDPTEAEREAAAMASAALMASRRVMTDRANESKAAQEREVSNKLLDAGFTEVPTRIVSNLNDAPRAGEFCGESMFGSRKADLVAGLWDGRAMPIECKVSNSSTNSIKRLNNDAAIKASTWLSEFGTRSVVPTAVLGGVFNRNNLSQAQEAGLTLFWAHDLDEMIQFIETTRSGPHVRR